VPKGGGSASARTCPAAYVTRDAGSTWTRLDAGLPERAWFAVKRQAMTVDELLHHLDRRYPGLRFRMVDEQGRLRQHMKVFLDGEMSRDLTLSLDGVGEVTTMQALSGG
jgi:sulfur-carrier protein